MTEEMNEGTAPPWAGVSEPDHIPPIRIMFAESLVGHRETLVRQIEALGEARSDLSHEAGLDESYGVAHQIRGTAATFLGTDLGEAAGDYTYSLSLIPFRTRPLTEIERAETLAGLHRLVQEIDRFLGWMRMKG